jgi:hypothetical protein
MLKCCAPFIRKKNSVLKGRARGKNSAKAVILQSLLVAALNDLYNGVWAKKENETRRTSNTLLQYNIPAFCYENQPNA